MATAKLLLTCRLTFRLTFKFSLTVLALAMVTANLLVPDLISGVNHAPSNYIRPIFDRPNLTEVQVSSQRSIPLIDLQGLNGPNRSDIIKQIAQACQNDGFFQVENHGIPDPMIDNMLSIAREFFRLPEGERLKMYSDDPSKTTRFTTSFNVKTEKTAFSSGEIIRWTQTTTWHAVVRTNKCGARVHGEFKE